MAQTPVIDEKHDASDETMQRSVSRQPIDDKADGVSQQLAGGTAQAPGVSEGQNRFGNLKENSINRWNVHDR